jgi:nucleotide-binding universal stress UspA family protein
MLRSLVVPLDGSKVSEAGLPLAARLARAAGTELHLAHVHVTPVVDQRVDYNPLPVETPFPIEGLAGSDEVPGEGEYLGYLAERLSRDGAVADASVLDGPNVADSLASYADEVDADMVLMVSHGRSGFRRLWFGSVTDDLVRHSSLPVLVARADHSSFRGDRGGNIVVVLDGSELAESAVGPAAEFAQAIGARVTLLYTEGDRNGAASYLEEIASPLRAVGLDVSSHAMFGAASGVGIARVATAMGADVIAMTTRGRGMWKRALLGSRADEVLSATRLPLLLVRPHAWV